MGTLKQLHALKADFAQHSQPDPQVANGGYVNKSAGLSILILAAA